MTNQATACDAQFGGPVKFTIGGQKYSASDGDVKIEVANVDVSAEMNSDGTLCRKVKLKPYKMDVTFREKSGIVWQRNMMMCSIDVTATMWPANITRWSRPAAVSKLGAGGSVPMAAIHCA